MNQKTAKLARKIKDMLDARDAGHLKRTADHFLSGLITAYGIMVDIDDVNEAMQHALNAADTPRR
jgi:hypothetical protein